MAVDDNRVRRALIVLTRRPRKHLIHDGFVPWQSSRRSHAVTISFAHCIRTTLTHSKPSHTPRIRHAPVKPSRPSAVNFLAPICSRVYSTESSPVGTDDRRSLSLSLSLYIYIYTIYTPMCIQSASPDSPAHQPVFPPSMSI